MYVHPPEPYFSLKKDPYDIFFTFFLQNKLSNKFQVTETCIVGQIGIILDFRFLT